ncbi:cobalt-precorrin 5A hydrolase [Clostridium intestinale]|uniref:Cobalamin biosynthesis protein CbiG n=1 Tax=Clostridium intestinale URNW TaxID=1294142 RepID=U2PQ13_9CLOT|nr:cobalt-precorrin 5A hydrolase [Clostridium intestinale]ERK28515.1 cobalamin biosynthesis protein CbiG [Clostridium intestinale URNW]
MIYILSVSSLGDILGEKLSRNFSSVYFSKDKIKAVGLNEITKEAMEKAKGIIFISSTGIAVRAIATYLKGKTIDPGVVVVDAKGEYAISLLSGHLGGGNELAIKVSEILKAMPIITTATDSLGVKAPDMIAKENNLLITDMKKAKDISAFLIEGKKVVFEDEDKIIDIPKGYIECTEGSENLPKVKVTNKKSGSEALVLVRKNLILGIGCRKDVPKEKMLDFIRESLKEYGYREDSVLKISTIDLKSKEEAILNISQVFSVPLEIHSRGEVRKIEHLFKCSDFVRKSIGVGAVAEPCVYLSGGEIVVERISKEGMTLCIGEGR